ncbi:MATE family efflux transporter [Endozoicomonas sp. Mp262]|uniref:MATE family efflux transporter n=1 Tax=Endozoicomonas sp. Mp262 TaxID=2919499 RepID=UPI0021DB025D
MKEDYKPRVVTILQLGLPMIVAMLSQSLINLVDAALVGPLGEEALAAVGAGSNATLVAMALIAGVSSGVQAQVARRVGKGLISQCAVPVNHGILIAFCFALPLSVALVIAAPFILKLYSPDLDTAVLYFRIRVMTLTAAVMNISFRGYWNGTSKPRGFLKILLISHVFNALTSYILIYGKLGLPAMGVAGAALGTFLSMYLCALLNIKSLRHKARQHGLFTRWRGRSSFIRLVTLALPDSIQQFFFCMGIMVLYIIISMLGTSEMAIAHVLINISLFLILPGVGLGIAATTLVSKSLGKKDLEDAWRWGRDVLMVAVVILMALGIPFIFFPGFFLSWFLHDPKLLAMAKFPLQLVCIGIIVDAGALVLPQALLGAGANRTVLCIRFFFQWLVLLPLCWLVGPTMGLGLSAIWAIQGVQRLLSSLTFIWFWDKRKWSVINI